MPEFNMPPGVSTRDIPGNQGPRYPQITVKLIGEDGNAFLILGRVIRAMKAHGCSLTEVTDFQEEACRGDYDHLLATVQEWVNVS